MYHIDDLPNEEWKDLHIKGAKREYLISNYGRIIRKPYLLNQRPNKDGYIYVSLVTRKLRNASKVHRLVAKEWIPNPDNKPEVNHKDGNRKNNYFKNLEWMTRSENMLHAFRILKRRHVFGETMPLAKLKNTDIEKIFDMRISGMKHREIGKYIGINSASITLILNRKAWVHVPIPEEKIKIVKSMKNQWTTRRKYERPTG